MSGKFDTEGSSSREGNYQPGSGPARRRRVVGWEGEGEVFGSKWGSQNCFHKQWRSLDYTATRTEARIADPIHSTVPSPFSAFCLPRATGRRVS